MENGRDFFVEVQGETYQFWFIHTPTRYHLWGNGTTSAHIQRMRDLGYAEAMTFCSRKDRYRRKKGEQESLRQLMDMLPWRKEDRERVWGAWREWRDAKATTEH